MILPDYLRDGFVRAALSYIACNGEGAFVCKDNDCWCSCEPKFPECNCPYTDIQAMEESLRRVTETWSTLYREFEDSGEATKTGGRNLLAAPRQKLRFFRRPPGVFDAEDPSRALRRKG